MPVLEVAKALLSLAEIYAKLTEGRDGDEAEQAASVSMVGAVMHHAAFELVRAYQRNGEAAAITNTKSKFELTIGRASVEVESLADGLICYFGGDLSGIVPIADRFQHVPVPALSFEAAIRMGRELASQVGAVLEAARRQHAAAR